jgi:hypothetical protein
MEKKGKKKKWRRKVERWVNDCNNKNFKCLSLCEKQTSRHPRVSPPEERKKEKEGEDREWTHNFVLW